MRCVETGLSDRLLYAGEMSEPRRHHTVPQFYFQLGFSKSYSNRKKKKSGTPRVLGIRLTDRKRAELSISDASVGTDFYRVEDLDDPIAFETFLSKVEGSASRIIKRILDSGLWPLSPEDRVDLAFFITLQYLRGHGERDEMSQVATFISKIAVERADPEDFIKRYEARSGEKLSTEEARELFGKYILPDAISAEVTPGGHIEIIMACIEVAFPYFLAATWALVRFEEGSLFTSDSPVNLIPREEHDSNSGLGLENAQAYVFPLSRDVGLVMVNHSDPDVKRKCFDGSTDHEIAPAESMSKLINHATLLGSHDWIYVHPDDAHLLPGYEDLPVRPHTTFQVERISDPSSQLDACDE